MCRWFRNFSRICRRSSGNQRHVEEISSTEIETALEEGRMDVGLGFPNPTLAKSSYERLCTDQFA